MPDYKNRFMSQSFIEQGILDEKGAVIGYIRIKPSGVSWKSKGAQRYRAVNLQQFIDWITDPTTKATTPKS
jgi:hypothetical protein